MKSLIASLLFLVFLVSCGSEGRLRGSSNEVCKAKNLQLSNYEFAKHEALNPNNDKSSGLKEPTDGRYVLTSSLVHFHDMNVKTSNGKNLQFMIAYNARTQNADDIEKNQKVFVPSIRCISGLRQDSNGKLNLSAELPLEINISGGGTSVEPTTLVETNISYKTDFRTVITANEVSDKSIDSIEQINEGGDERTTKLLVQQKDITKKDDQGQKTTETIDQNNFQLVSRVTIDNRMITVVNRFKRCISPDEVEDIDDKSDKEVEKITKTFEDCLSVSLITKDKLN